MRGTGFWIGLAGVLIAGVMATRLGVNEYYFFAGYVVLQFVVIATAWNILGGYAGYVNFGSAGFFAIGVYCSIALIKSVALPLPLLILAGAVAAGTVGFAMGLVPFFRRMMEPITEFFRFIPAIAMVVFSLIWFGIGESSKIFLIVYNTFFSVALATEAGVTHVVPSRIHAVRSMGASQIQVVRFVVIPSVIPYVIQGMRISMGRAFATIVSAAILAANSGLGFLIFSAREFSKMDTVIVAIIVLGILGLVIDRLFRRFTVWLGREYLPSGI